MPLECSMARLRARSKQRVIPGLARWDGAMVAMGVAIRNQSKHAIRLAWRMSRSFARFWRIVGGSKSVSSWEADGKRGQLCGACNALAVSPKSDALGEVERCG